MPNTHSRTLLAATADRPDGYYAPSGGRSLFDNADGSAVILQIAEPGLWVVGWKGYVRSQGGFAAMEADVFLSAAGADPLEASDSDPLANFVAYAIVESGSNRDVWLEAMSAVAITRPSQIVACVYSNVGVMQIAKVVDYLATPTLFAWPIG